MSGDAAPLLRLWGQSLSKSRSVPGAFLFARIEWTRAEARRWLRRNGHVAEHVVEKTSTWVFPQPVEGDVVRWRSRKLRSSAGRSITLRLAVVS